MLIIQINYHAVPSMAGSKITIDNMSESLRFGGRKSRKFMFDGMMDEVICHVKYKCI